MSKKKHKKVRNYCMHCGGKIRVMKTVAGEISKFCSDGCMLDYNEKQLRRSSSKSCLNCGLLIITHPNTVRPYCHAMCMQEHERKLWLQREEECRVAKETVERLARKHRFQQKNFRKGIAEWRSE